jgi:hypothetical protein
MAAKIDDDDTIEDEWQDCLTSARVGKFSELVRSHSKSTVRAF